MTEADEEDENEDEDEVVDFWYLTRRREATDGQNEPKKKQRKEKNITSL